MRWTVLILALVQCASTSLKGEERRFLLHSVYEQMTEKAFEFSGPSSEGPGVEWQVSRRQLRTGALGRISIVSIDNGRIRVDVLPSRGMSIIGVYDSVSSERLLGWHLPTDDGRDESLLELDRTRRYADGLHECLFRCGLRFKGHDGIGPRIRKPPGEGNRNRDLHGRVSYYPSAEVVLIVEGDPISRIQLQSTIKAAGFLGPYPELIAAVVLESGSASIDLIDNVSNPYDVGLDYQLVYHTGFGPPLVDDGAELDLAIGQRRSVAEASLADIPIRWGRPAAIPFGLPGEHTPLQALFAEPLVDPEGRATAVLHNAGGDLGVEMSWNVDALPYLVVWRQPIASAGGYVTGIEPATGYPMHERIEREEGRVPHLAPGESREFRVKLDILDSREAVTSAKSRLSETIAASHKSKTR